MDQKVWIIRRTSHIKRIKHKLSSISLHLLYPSGLGLASSSRINDHSHSAVETSLFIWAYSQVYWVGVRFRNNLYPSATERVPTLHVFIYVVITGLLHNMGNECKPKQVSVNLVNSDKNESLF